jgi:hypothetical protein
MLRQNFHGHGSSTNTHLLWLDLLQPDYSLTSQSACHYYSSPLAQSRKLRTSLLQKCRASSSSRSSTSEAIFTSPRHSVRSRPSSHSSKKCICSQCLSSAVGPTFHKNPNPLPLTMYDYQSTHARAHAHTHTHTPPSSPLTSSPNQATKPLN